ncbi:MAG: cytochrome c maturation protein CcmE [Kofleriaceae bacterium]
MQHVMVARIGLTTAVKVGLTAAVMFGGMALLAHASATEVSHYKMVDELIGEGLAGWRGKALKVNGWVTPGSVVNMVVHQELRHTFVLQKSGKHLRVFASGPLPDTFEQEAEVVVTGRLVAAGAMQPMADAMCAGHAIGCPVQTDAEQAWVLDATEISAKCTSHYDGGAARTRRAPAFK